VLASTTNTANINTTGVTFTGLGIFQADDNAFFGLVQSLRIRITLSSTATSGRTIQLQVTVTTVEGGVTNTHTTTDTAPETIGTGGAAPGGGLPTGITQLRPPTERCVVTPVTSFGIKVVLLRNQTGGTVNVTNIAPSAGSDWDPATFTVLRGLGSYANNRVIVILIRGGCAGTNLGIDVTIDGTVVALGDSQLASSPTLVKPLSVELRGGLLSVQAQGAKSVKAEVFSLNGQKLLEAEGFGGRLTTLAVDGTGRPLANGVYLVAVTVEKFDGTITREIRKVVVVR